MFSVFNYLLHYFIFIMKRYKNNLESVKTFYEVCFIQGMNKNSKLHLYRRIIIAQFCPFSKAAVNTLKLCFLYQSIMIKVLL